MGLKDAVQEIVARLNPGWCAFDDSGQPEDGVVVRHSDGRAFRVRLTEDVPPRLKIVGDYSGASWQTAQGLSITVRADQSPAAIALSIRRRFLPRYTELYVLAAARDRGLRSAVRDRGLRSVVPKPETRPGRPCRNCGRPLPARAVNSVEHAYDCLA